MRAPEPAALRTRILRSPWGAALLVGASFFTLAEVSAPFVFAPYQNAVVWLPGGLALGALIRTRRTHWPHLLGAVFVAEVCSVILHGDPLVVAALWGTANCARTYVAAELMRRFVGPPMQFDRLRDVSGLVAFGGVVGPAVSAGIGTAAVALFYDSANLWTDWLFWFLSDAMGTVLVAPLILTATLRKSAFEPVRVLEWCALTAVLLIVGDALFGAEPSGLRASLPFIGFPLLIYAALRTGPPGAAFASVLLGAIAVWRTSEGRGPFGDPAIEAYSRVLAVETFIAVMSLSALTLAAAVKERQKLEERQRLLANVGNALAESLDLRTTLPRAARRFVPDAARGVALWLLQPDGSLTLAAHEGVAAPGLRRLEEQAAYLSVNTPSWVDPCARSVLLPLRGHDAMLGVVAVLPRDSRRDPTRVELALFQEFARACALAVENARLYEASQRAIHMRDEFIAIAAHELRTPLTSMRLQLEGALRRQQDEAERRLPHALLRQVARLTRLVENLLDISRLTRGRLELSYEPTDLSTLAREVAARLRDEAARVGSELVVRVDDGVRGVWDPLRIEQVVTNLLSNAIKFGSGKPIELRVETRGDEAHLSVTDHGRGIPAHEVKRIFDRFAQAVPAREFGGLGLGLFLAREIAEAHGGRIWVTSDPGKGSTFSLTLPTRPSAALWTDPASAPAPPP